MKQTAVEWLEIRAEERKKYYPNESSVWHLNQLIMDFEQAKEMDKEQKGYSEKEVKRLAFDFYYDMSHKMGVATNLISENATNVDVWFDKIKNK